MWRPGRFLFAAATTTVLALLWLRYVPKLHPRSYLSVPEPAMVDSVSHVGYLRPNVKEDAVGDLVFNEGLKVPGMSANLTQSPSSLYALATLVLSSEFVSRALVLCRNLKTMKPYWPPDLHAIALVPTDYQSRNISKKKLTCCFDRVIALRAVEVKRPSKYEKFHEQYIKLNMWSLVNYTRLLYMDGDVYVVDPWALYELVQTKVSFGACKDFWGRS